MGKSQKLKEQRKLDSLTKELNKEAKWRMIRLVTAGVAAGIFLASLSFWGIKTINTRFFSDKNRVATGETKSYKNGDHKYSQAPDMQIDTNKIYVAKFETAQGNFEVTLSAKDAPKTVNNFVTLVKDGFYDGLTFHRIMKGFMIQGGDPDGTGGGGPGYTVPAEIALKHTKGAIATARQGDESNPDRNSSGSQFFIDLEDQPSLDEGGYSVFGYVTSGMDIVTKIGDVSVTFSDGNPNEQSKPIEKVIINKVTIEEK